MIQTALAALAVAALAFSLPAQAVTVVQWDFEALPSTLSVSGTSYTGVAASTGTGTAVASGVHTASSTFSSPAGNGSPRSLSANGWAPGDYWQFSFSTTGYSGLSLSFDQAGSATGPRDFSLTYSTDGTNFTTFGSYVVQLSSWTSASTNASFTYSFNLAGVTALDNKPTVYFRLIDVSTTSINAGTVASGGTDRVDNFTIVTSAVPEAGSGALLLAGLAVLGMMAQRRKA